MESHSAPPVDNTASGSFQNGFVDGAALVQLLQHANFSRPTPPQLQQQTHSNSALMSNISALLSNISQGGNNTLQSTAPLPLPPSNALLPQSLTMHGQPVSEAVYLSALRQQMYQRPMAQPTVQPPVHSATLDTLAGTLPDDETILVNTLSTRKLKGRNVREALEALHGVCPIPVPALRYLPSYAGEQSYGGVMERLFPQ